MGRIALVLLTAAGIGLAGAASLPPTAPDVPYRAPYLPGADDEPLQLVPPASDPAVRRMATLRAELDANPKDVRIAAQLAAVYIDFGRRVGDAHYAGYGEAVLAPWMAEVAPPVGVLVLQATILQFRHEFADARKLLRQAVKRDPQNAQAWLTLATLDMVQGDYATAATDCAQTARAGGYVLTTACNGNLRSYLGQARQSVALLATIEGDAPNLDSAFKAWVQGLLAESCERLGDWTGAEGHYRKALAYAPDDNFLLVAYADFLLDRKRPAEVMTLLADHTQSDTAFLRLALAQAALNAPDVARYTWIMAARFEALTQRGSEFYGREQVRFALHLQHDPQTALALAQRNWAVQRAPWDARVLLEAAQAADRPEAAAPVLAFLQQTKLEDPIIEPLARQLRNRADPTKVAR